mgnify:FL=1|tara:strand:+ start:4082 stop:4306 length:225 start_codon:yes stop_codon:yes gene_type:complete
MEKDLSNKLKHLIYISGKNRKELYTQLRMSQPTFLAKINNPMRFKIGELVSLLKLLNVGICDFFNAHLILTQNG